MPRPARVTCRRWWSTRAPLRNCSAGARAPASPTGWPKPWPRSARAGELGQAGLGFQGEAGAVPFGFELGGQAYAHRGGAAADVHVAGAVAFAGEPADQGEAGAALADAVRVEAGAVV